MDRYLWLSGMYRAWDGAADRDKLGLSEEVTRLFDSDDPEARRALAALRGETPSA
jgi:hypothetical protein